LLQENKDVNITNRIIPTTFFFMLFLLSTMRAKLIIISVFVFFGLLTPNKVLAQDNPRSNKRANKELVKQQKKKRKEAKKDDKAAMKWHYKSQGKSTRKRMKKNHRKTKRLLKNKKPPFWKTWFR